MSCLAVHTRAPAHYLVVVANNAGVQEATGNIQGRATHAEMASIRN